MKNILFVLVLLIGCVGYSQDQVAVATLWSGEEIELYDGSNSNGKAKWISGISIKVYGPLGHDEGHLYYFSKSGSDEKVKVKEIEKVIIGDSAIILRPFAIRGKQFRLMEIIAENSNYYLANLSSGGLEYFYIADKGREVVEKQILHSTKKSKSEKAIAKVEEYFPTCTELISQLKDNLAHPMEGGFAKRYFILYRIQEKEATNYLTNFKCD